MSGLPEGWDSDYDGRRWFYKYKPTGHIQYHFPKEGDEFPDFIDTFSPAPVLAPEERLESQQQIRRHASTTTPARFSPKKEDGGYGMSATARPVSMTWDGGFEDEENGVFQPENFMYLGPGTYNDVSPLAEEEEEAARRVVAGGIEGRVEKSSSKGVSPLNSEKTTPAQGSTTAGPVTGEPVLVPPTVVEEIHEMPAVEPPPSHDPVGIIAEMPTDDTAQAHIEKHPPPIEMADNMVLAPIETAISMMAELPERTSPKTKKNEEPQLAPGSLRDYGAQMQPLRISKKPAEEIPPSFQSYKPAGISVDIPPIPAPLRRATFQPGGPMIDASPVRPPDRGHSGTPNVLSPPQVPPKRPLDEPSQPQIPPKHPEQQRALSIANNGSLGPDQQPELSHMPSVLKPARGKVPGLQTVSGPARPPQGHGYIPPTQGKHPPSMTPAPLLQQQRLEEPRMGVQRVNTVPDLLPSQRPQSTVQTGHQVLAPSATNKQHVPKRPASVMPDMMVGQSQEQIQGRYNAGPQQGGNPPYRVPVENVPPKGLPRSATAGPTTPFPPYPVDNPPYPDDRPVYRREIPPYPEEPFVQKQISGQGSSDPSHPIPSNRRHSSFSSAVVSPDSRHGSMSFPTQTPSPMEQSRRASTNSSINPNYTPSPVSQTSSSMQSFSPTPPSVPTNQYQQGSYFTMQDVEGQGHNVAARDVLRKKSLSRSTDARRSSVGADPVAAQRGSSLTQQTGQGYNIAPQGVSRSQSLRQLPQGNVAPQNQPPTAPTPPPQGQQGLGRIEEYEETPSATVSRSSTVSVSADMRKGSVGSSVHPSPMGSRRTSWQAESPKNVSPIQFQGQQGPIPQSHAGQPMHQVQAPQGAPMAAQNPKQLQRKPSQGHAPQPQNQQMSARDSRPPQGVPPQQGLGSQGQPMQGPVIPPQVQGEAPHPGQVSTPVQNVLHKPPPAPAPTPPALAPKPTPTRLQKRSSYPTSSAGQLPPQPQLPRGPVPPGQTPQGPAPGPMPPQGQQQMAYRGQGSNGRVQPQVQIPPNQQQWRPGMQPMTPQGARPVSMQMPAQPSQSAGAKEGKEGKKWLKWLKGGSKSVSHSPTTPVISSPISPAVGRPSWGGGEYAQQAVWQPGQPMSSAQPGFQGNMVPPQSQPGKMHQPAQPPTQTVQAPPQHDQMGFRPSQPLPRTGTLPPQVAQFPQASQASQQPSQMAPQSGQMLHQGGPPAQLGQIPPQTMQLPPQQRQPPHHRQIPVQQGQTNTHPGPAPTPSTQVPPQAMQLPPQNRQPAHQQERMPTQQIEMQPQSNQMTSGPCQVPPPGPAPRNPQPEPRGYSTGGPSVEVSVTQPATLPPKVPEPSMAPPFSVEPSIFSQRQAPPQRQPSPAQPKALEQAPMPQSKAPKPPQPPQMAAPNTLQPQPNSQRSISPPPPAVSPGLSDAAASSISRMSSYRRDSFSDAGSITTIEVAQAQPQPVLKPSIVQVHRRSTDMINKSQVHLNNDSQSSSDVTPRISAETARVGTEAAPPPSNLQYQQAASRPELIPQVNTSKHDINTAPLPSKPDETQVAQPHTRDQHMNKEAAPHKADHRFAAYANSGFQNQNSNNNTNPISNIPQPAPAKPAGPVAEDKWAKKPVVDYSGGDWGDDDDWDY
ncbi:hypothetical protein FGADI_9917 [Fusarium gaditjirri]|uniref:General RNA polymerase II transcription factor TAF12 n=1 Tax=Fusarium gaditjirri TaxID=282569 RepID=A0A8H4SYS2_9HYPO|nr:hypothetical protein FGADI_9917 [Fusarium gaditjirri]